MTEPIGRNLAPDQFQLGEVHTVDGDDYFIVGIGEEILGIELAELPPEMTRWKWWEGASALYFASIHHTGDSELVPEPTTLAVRDDGYDLPDPDPSFDYPRSEEAIPAKIREAPYYVGNSSDWESGRVNLWDAIRDGSIRIRIPQGAFKRVVMCDGRWKTQHETGQASDGGNTNPAGRRSFENDYFGYSDDTPAEARPVYGYVAGSTDSRLDEYGYVAVELKDSIKMRTTVTVGDSWNRNEENGPDSDFGMFPSLATHPHPDSVPEVIELHHRSHDARATSLSDINVFVEAQIHGGVRLNDVKTAYFRASPPCDQLRDALEAFDIDYEFTDPYLIDRPLEHGG